MYNVAFVYTAKAGGYEGVVTWTSFPSKEYFDKFYTDAIKERERVVEEGISQDRCVELVRQTPRACRIAAVMQEATSTKSGEVNQELLAHGLENIAFAEAFERQEQKEKARGRN